MDFEELTAEPSSKFAMDDDLYGDQDFDMDELDADGFSGLDELADRSTESDF